MSKISEGIHVILHLHQARDGSIEQLVCVLTDLAYLTFL